MMVISPLPALFVPVLDHLYKKGEGSLVSPSAHFLISSPSHFSKTIKKKEKASQDLP